MARYTVAPDCVTAKQACEWVGLDYDTYLKLIKESCLRRPSERGVGLEQFVALYLFSRLSTKVGFDRIRPVWEQVRDQIPVADAPPEYLKLFVGTPMPVAQIVRSPAELDGVMDDEEAGRAIDLAAPLAKARAFFTEALRLGAEASQTQGFHVLEGA